VGLLSARSVASFGPDSAANGGSSWDIGNAGSRWWITHYEAGARNPITVRTTLRTRARHTASSSTLGVLGQPRRTCWLVEALQRFPPICYTSPERGRTKLFITRLRYSKRLRSRGLFVASADADRQFLHRFLYQRLSRDEACLHRAGGPRVTQGSIRPRTAADGSPSATVLLSTNAYRDRRDDITAYALRRAGPTRTGGCSNSASMALGHPSLRAMNFSHHTRRTLERDC
jgi:hypothetical protein